MLSGLIVFSPLPVSFVASAALELMHSDRFMRDEISFARLPNLGHVRCSLKRCVCKTTINYGDKCNIRNWKKKGFFSIL